MKKTLLITILIIITVCALALTGCGGGTPVQKKLGNGAPWISFRDQKEISSYNVVNKVDDVEKKGTYTIEISRYSNKNCDLTIADKSLTGFQGYIAVSKLTMDNGDVIESKVATETTMRTKYAETKATVDGKTYSYFAEYGPKAVTYNVNDNGNSISDSIKIKDFYAKPFTDNTMIYLLARCLPKGSVQFAINIPNFKTNKMDQILLNRRNENADFEMNAIKYKVSTIEIAYNRTFPGVGDPIKVYISEKPIKNMTVINEGADPFATPSPILQFVEGNTSYSLTNTIIENI